MGVVCGEGFAGDGRGDGGAAAAGGEFGDVGVQVVQETPSSRAIEVIVSSGRVSRSLAAGSAPRATQAVGRAVGRGRGWRRGLRGCRRR